MYVCFFDNCLQTNVNIFIKEQTGIIDKTDFYTYFRFYGEQTVLKK